MSLVNERFFEGYKIFDQVGRVVDTEVAHAMADAENIYHTNQSAKALGERVFREFKEEEALDAACEVIWERDANQFKNSPDYIKISF